MHVSEPKITPGVAEGKLLVIETQQPEDGGMQVMNVDLIFDGLETKLIRRAVDVAAPHAPAGQPHAEPIMIMVAPVYLAGVRPGFWQLHRRRAPKFTAPNHQRVLQHSALLEVFEQRP